MQAVETQRRFCDAVSPPLRDDFFLLPACGAEEEAVLLLSGDRVSEPTDVEGSSRSWSSIMRQDGGGEEAS